jgi:hypothetical protein
VPVSAIGSSNCWASDWTDADLAVAVPSVLARWSHVESVVPRAVTQCKPHVAVLTRPTREHAKPHAVRRFIPHTVRRNAPHGVVLNLHGAMLARPHEVTTHTVLRTPCGGAVVAQRWGGRQGRQRVAEGQDELDHRAGRIERVPGTASGGS